MHRGGGDERQHADHALDQHRAVADRRMWLSLSTILGVVPEATSAWKPEIAPQAMVMKQNGKSGPGMIGPPPLMYSVSGRHLQHRVDDDDAEDQQCDRADLHERAEVVARREQQPDRQHRGGEAVDADREDQLLARQAEPAADAPNRDG